MIDPQMKALMDAAGDNMENWIVIQPTNWYTKSGNIGNNINKKLPVGWTFQSDAESYGRRNVVGTNMWIPTFACKLDTPVPPPPPTTDPQDFVKVVVVDSIGLTTEFDLVKRASQTQTD